jgi:hypothetical protein
MMTPEGSERKYPWHIVKNLPEETEEIRKKIS